MPILVTPSRFTVAGATYDSLITAISGLVGRWKCDNASGTTLTASTGSNGAIAASGVTYSSTGLVGDGGTALTLDGSTGELTAPVSNSQPVGSLIIWWKFTSDAGTIFRDNTSSAGVGWRMDISGTNPIVRANGTEHTVSTITSASLKDGLRHMFVVTMDGTTAKLYVDGVQVDSWAKTGDFSMSTPAHFGRNGTTTGTANFFGGVWDDIAYFSTTVAAADISALYAAS
jgi:hypothetical protein